MTDRTALVVGATGLVGKEIINYILSTDYYQQVKVLTRRKLEVQDSRIEYIIVADFDKLAEHQHELYANDYYCALGTTIKQVGTKAKFTKVDYTYPVELAKIAQHAPNFKQYLVVTAAGSNAKSPIFYNKVKGQLEEALKGMSLPGLKIFRPSLLLGDREEARLGEQAAKVVSKFLSFFMVGSGKALLAVEGSDVAKAMVETAVRGKGGVETFNAKQIYQLAKSADH